MSGRLAPSTARPTGTPWPSTSRLRLTPFLARSVGFLPVFFPPEGCLGHAPVHAQPGPVDAREAVIVEQALLPELEEDAGLDPLLETVVGSGAGAKLGGIEGLPLTARAEDIEDGIGTDPIRSTRPSAAEAVRIHMLGKEDLHHLPQLIGDAPVIGDMRQTHNGSSFRYSCSWRSYSQPGLFG